MRTTPIDEGGHTRRSAGCGRVAFLRNRANRNRGAVARLYCKTRNCHDCGPHRAQRLHGEYLELLTAWWNLPRPLGGDGPRLWAFTIAPEAWPSLARKLRRRDVPYCRIPIAAGEDLILSTASTEHDVRKITTLADLESTLEAAFTWHPGYAGDLRRPSQRGFSETEQAEQAEKKPQVNAGAGVDRSTGEPTGWELLGFAGKGITLAEAMRIADSLELEPQPVPERKLAADWAEAFELNLPDETSTTYRLLVERLRLRAPGEHRHQRGRKAPAEPLGVAA